MADFSVVGASLLQQKMNCRCPPCCEQRRNEGGMGAQFHRRRITMGALHYYCGRRVTVWGAEKSQQCRNYFLHYSTFASERPQVRTWGRQTCIL